MKIKFIRIIYVVALTMLTFNGLAQSNKEALLNELVVVTGCIDQMNEQKEIIKQQSEASAQQMVNQIMGSFGVKNSEYEKIVKNEIESYLVKTADIFDVDFAIEKYKELIEKEMTEEDIISVINFYKSESGLKFVEANLKITPEWTTAFMKDIEEKILKELNVLANNIKKSVSIAREKNS